MKVPATALRTVLTVVILVGLIVWSFLDLDTADKVGGVVACLLALPTIWLLPRTAQSTTTSGTQHLRRVRSKGSIRQKSQSPAQQKIVRATAEGDIEQSQ